MSMNNQMPGTASPWSAQSVPAPARHASAAAAAPSARRARDAELRLRRVDPWSVLFVSLLLSTVAALVWVGACALLFVAMDKIGAVAALNDVYTTLIKPAEGDEVVAGPVTMKNTVAIAGVLGLFGVVLTFALATLTASIYNVCSRLTGGVRVTLGED